ncbi:MAG: RNA 2',3'-cyclic phosphodiesterase [Chloroflexi bacterium OHK40]
MRLFIALSLPEHVRQELAAVQVRLRGHPLRPVEPQGLHLTLQFLGDVHAELVAPLLDALSALPPVRIQLRLAGLGGFPNLEQPRVVWAGVGGDLATLAELQRRVVGATARLGLPTDERPYRPHLTLGRVPQSAPVARVRALGAAVVACAPPAPLVWEAAGPTLYESTLTRAGAVYTVLGP